MSRFSLVAMVLLVVSCSAVPVAQADALNRGPYSMEAIDESGNPLPVFQQSGRSYVLGRLGQRYLLRVRNFSDRRIEIVASVDGRDVVDGQTASFDKRGYVVNPHDELSIDGFRVSNEAVAAFRFSRVSRSYAAQMGSARDVGVVGVAVFTERVPVYVYRRPALPFKDEVGGSGMRGQEFDGMGSLSERSEPEAKADDAPAAAAPSASNMMERRADVQKKQRSGLGTEFGEQHASQVYNVEFIRASSQPAAVLTFRYNDEAGLRAMGIQLYPEEMYGAREPWMRETAEPFRSNTNYAKPPPGWNR